MHRAEDAGGGRNKRNMSSLPSLRARAHRQWSITHVPKASLGRWFGGGGQGSQMGRERGDMGPEEDQVATALLHAVGNTNLSARREQRMGRGVFTTSTVLPGATVARSTLVIDARRALAMPAYCHSIDFGPDDDDVEVEDPYVVLCVFLYRFLYCSSKEIRDAESTALSCYREVLLADASSSVLEWTDDEVDLLAGSHLYTIASDLRCTGEATIRAVNDLLGGDKDPDELRRCLSILVTRLVRLDDGSVALVPGLDLLNHSSSSRSYIAGTREGVHVVNRGLLSKESQVFVSYGGKTSGELFLSYGFFPEENPHDGVLVPLDGGETAVVGIDGSVRLVGSELGIDRERVRTELKQGVRRQLEAMKGVDGGRADGGGAGGGRADGGGADGNGWSNQARDAAISGLMISQRKLLSRALMSL